MRLVSWCLVLACTVFGSAIASGCGSTSHNKGSGGGSGSGGTSGSGGSGGKSSNSSGTGGKSSSSNSTGGAAGSGGTGGSGGGGSSSEPSSAECGGMTCEGLSFGLAGIQNADACCPDGADQPACGLDTSPLQDFDFTIPTDCQPRNSPGELDDACPESPQLSVSNVGFTFPGCCLPSGKCGYMLDSVAGLIPLDLGCIDATQYFPDQGEPPDCTPATGAGGEGGAAN